mmetsp:Transcript_12703/g.38943  ORF Transcript_12703/g.38943 Transcript_12703/m.38943 type:complete len:186 (-) Transcript_12703:658-1215(-)
MGATISQLGSNAGKHLYHGCCLGGKRSKDVELCLRVFRDVLGAQAEAELGRCSVQEVEVLLMTNFDIVETVQNGSFKVLENRALPPKIIAIRQAAQRLALSFLQEKGNLIHLCSDTEVFLSYYIGEGIVLIGLVRARNCSHQQMEKLSVTIDRLVRRPPEPRQNDIETDVDLSLLERLTASAARR